jgi:hypothetical protein
MVYSTLVTLRRKGYQGRSPWLVTFRRKISDFGIVADEVRKASPAGCRQGLFEGLIG